MAWQEWGWAPATRLGFLGKARAAAGQLTGWGVVVFFSLSLFFLMAAATPQCLWDSVCVCVCAHAQGPGDEASSTDWAQFSGGWGRGKCVSGFICLGQWVVSGLVLREGQEPSCLQVEVALCLCWLEQV